MRDALSSLEWGAHLVHRHHPGVTCSPLMVEQQPVIDRFDVIVGHIVKRSVRQIGGPIKQRIAYFFAHARIVIGGQRIVNSQFPVVGFVHGATLGQGNANKNVRGIKT